MAMIRVQAALAGICAGICFGMASSDVRAQDSFYKGKRLTVLVNFAIGGGSDLEGRLLAKYLAKHLDGRPNIIVQNMDGAGGLVGANYLGEVAPKDGTYIGYLSSAAGLYLTEPELWRVDLRSYEFIAYVLGTTVYYVRTDVAPGMKEPTDIVKAKELIAGGQSANSPKDLRLRLALDMLGVPFQYVTAYRSSATGRLALQRGEINIFSESTAGYRTAVEPSLVRTGLAIPVWYDLGDAADPPPPQKQMEGLIIPSFPQLHKKIKGTVPSGNLWEAYRTLFDINLNLQRLVALPPGAPQAASDALRKAIEGINTDKDFVAEAVKTMEVAPEFVTAPDTNQQVRAMLYAAPEMRTFINNYTKNVPKR